MCFIKIFPSSLITLDPEHQMWADVLPGNQYSVTLIVHTLHANAFRVCAFWKTKAQNNQGVSHCHGGD